MTSCSIGSRASAPLRRRLIQRCFSFFFFFAASIAFQCTHSVFKGYSAVSVPCVCVVNSLSKRRFCAAFPVCASSCSTRCLAWLSSVGNTGTVKQPALYLQRDALVRLLMDLLCPRWGVQSPSGFVIWVRRFIYFGFFFPTPPCSPPLCFFFSHFIYPVVCISGGNGSVSVSQGVAAPSIIVYLIVCACLCVKERERRRGMENSAVHHPRSPPPAGNRISG